MASREWQPIPLSVPDLPQEPPPQDRYPQKKDRIIDDPNKDKEEKPPTDREAEESTSKRGSVVINGTDKREWNPFSDKFSDPFKDDTDM